MIPFTQEPVIPGEPRSTSYSSRPGNSTPPVPTQTRTIENQVITRSAAFWAVFDNSYDYLKGKGFPLAAAIEYADTNINGSYAPEGLYNFGIKYGIDPNFFMGSGSGGSGASRAERIKSLAARIQNDSRTLGLNLTPEKIAYIATVAEKLNWSEDQVRDDILTNVDWNTLEGGDLKAQVDGIKTMGRNFLIPIDDNTAKDYAIRLSSGELSQEGIMNIFRTQALTVNPWAKTAIEQGLTPADILKPHQQYIAQSLEIDPGMIDIADDKYLKMMTVADQTGGTRVATLSEVRKNVRQDARWANTSEARDLGSSMASMVARIFGRSSF
jgi:hypothetical protein